MPALSVLIDAVDAANGENSTMAYTLPPQAALSAVEPTPVVFGPTAVGQHGALTGITIETNAADMSLVSVMVADQSWGYRG